MNITIQKKQAFAVAGVNEHSINSSLCPSVWDKLYEKYSHDELASLGNGQSIGVCHDVENPSTINYMAGYIVNDVDKARSMDLDVLEVDEAEYVCRCRVNRMCSRLHSYRMEICDGGILS